MGNTNASISHDELVAQIRTMIVDGVLPPGSKIPERELCERFKISRTPLREVLKVLAAEGHVTLSQNKGARVVLLTTRDVDELYEVLGALEALAGELAIARMTNEELAEIKAMHYEMALYHQRRELAPYYALNRRIHEAIAKASRSVVLQTLYEQIGARIRRARFVAAMPNHRWDEAMSEHEGILNALVRRDPVTLAAILKMHLRNKSKQVVSAGFAVEAEPEETGAANSSRKPASSASKTHRAKA
jgi:DNA-binding GntR family transcriptional regulator